MNERLSNLYLDENESKGTVFLLLYTLIAVFSPQNSNDLENQDILLLNIHQKPFYRTKLLMNSSNMQM
jgi:hypothetical protein